MKESSTERKRAVKSGRSEYKNENIQNSRGLSKAHLRYWEEAIFQRRPGGNWWVQIQHAGRREKLSLGTPIKAPAAARARDIYHTLLAKGWDETLAEWRPQSVPRSNTTIGDFLAELKAKADLKPQTLEGYAKAFRKIVSDIFEIGDGNAKCDYWGGGFKEWLDKVHAVKLAEVTPERVQAWKRAFLAKAGDKPIRQRVAKISVNSFIRRAKSLFAPAAVKHLSVELPTPLPFAGISFEPRQSTLYRSSFDASKLIQAARDELVQDDPAAFLVVLLGLCVGLRKGEIDLLPWSAVDFRHSVIRIEPTEYFAPKTEHSIGDVPLDPEIVELLRGFRARTQAPFVVPAGHRKPTQENSHQYYRCEPVFDRVLVWLRKHGVRGPRPLHQLRKEFGSLIHEKFDLVTAKELLRHSSVAVTAARYVENRKRGTTGLGVLLTKDRTIIPMEESTATTKDATTAAAALPAL
jgi:integrase